MATSYVILLGLSRVLGHGAVTFPRTRNSVDYLVGVNVPADWPSDRGCVNMTGDDCNNGQAAFWYSQGCFIGCPECDHMSGRRQVDLCGLGKKATLNEPWQRSVNREAVAGSPEDIYKHNPWRAPGTAPIGDVCGLAGGTPWRQNVGEAGDYTTTKYAHHGMNGSTLPPLPDGVQAKWKIGGEVEVSWQIENNHGGGYSYRLCPADSPLTEECFRNIHLDFVTDKQSIVHKNGSRTKVPNSTFISEGTYPEGSMWSRIPIPSDWLGPRCIPGPDDTNSTPNKCLKGETGLMDGPCVPCPGTPGSDCSRCDNGPKPAFPPPCDGCVGCTHEHAIVDSLKIPETLKPGKYVLGFRYDCEATAQVWQQCSDVELVL